jgi:hypothetical protein
VLEVTADGRDQLAGTAPSNDLRLMVLAGRRADLDRPGTAEEHSADHPQEGYEHDDDEIDQRQEKRQTDQHKNDDGNDRDDRDQNHRDRVVAVDANGDIKEVPPTVVSAGPAVVPSLPTITKARS